MLSGHPKRNPRAISRIPGSLFFLLGLWFLVSPAAGQEDYPLLLEKNLEWKLLPSDLTRKVFPLTDPDDLRFKLGETSDGQQFLKIQPPRLHDLSFGIRPTEHPGSYIASAKRAVYWPRQHLLRLEKEVIVSSTHCNLKGEVFDIHLHHDTVRLEDPEEILFDDISLPVVSQGIRLSGVGHNRVPDFEWDPVIERNAREEEPAPTPSPTPVPEITEEPGTAESSIPPRQHDLHIGERWNLEWDGESLSMEELAEILEKMAAEEPQSSVLIHQSAAANPVQVREIQQALKENGIDHAKTTVVPSEISQARLQPEVEPQSGSADFVLPPLSEKGGRLLWVYEPGRFNLNGRDFNEPSLRQALRAYSRKHSDLTLVIASPQPLPKNYLRELIRDIRAFGFTNILIGVRPD